MGKKIPEKELIDESLLLGFAGSRDFASSTSQEVGKRNEPANKPLRKTENNYERNFLKPVRFTHRTAVYVSRDVKRLLKEIVRLSADEEMTVTSLVENIMADHLEKNKEKINELFTERKKDRLL